MQHRDGSNARYPHSSSRSNPLYKQAVTSGQRHHGSINDIPHAKHVNEVLFCDVVLLVDVPLQRREDVPLVEKVVAALALQVEKLIICNATTNFLAGYQKNTRSLATYIGDNFNVKLYLLILTMARIRWLLMLRTTTTMETAGVFKLC